jgi:transcriptional regulator GlxA family with amidase domain
MTPARAIERLRVEAARSLVEDGQHTFGNVARLTGVGDTGRMCQSFLRIVGRSPHELRRSAHQDRPVRQVC